MSGQNGLVSKIVHTKFKMIRNNEFSRGMSVSIYNEFNDEPMINKGSCCFLKEWVAKIINS